MKKSIYPHILLLSVNLIYGINFSVAKLVMPRFTEPFGFVVLRGFSAFVFFWTLSFLVNKGRHKVEKKDFFRLFLAAVFGVCINQLSFFKGLQYTTPISSSIIMTIVPSIVLLFSYFFLKKKITFVNTLGVMIGLLGALILIIYGRQSVTADAKNPALGNFLVLINAVTYSFYLISAKPLLEKYNQLEVLKWMFTFGFFLSLPFGAKEVFKAKYAEMNLLNWLSFGFVLLFVSCLTYLFNLTALSKVNPSTVSIYIYTQPFFAVIIALIFGSDTLDFVKIIAGIVIFIGVYLVSIKDEKIEPAIVSEQ